MADDPRHDAVRAHIARIAARPERETDLLVSAALRRSWPGGGDHRQPGALEWVRRWGPARAAAAIPACGCATGPCAVCN